MKRISVLILSGCVLLFACSKDNNDTPTDPEPTPEDIRLEAAKKLQTSIIGKFSIPAFSLDKRRSHPVTITSASGRHGLVAGRDPSPTENPPGDNNSFIEFTADSLFVILDENGKMATGKYLAWSGDSVTLHGIGGIGGIKTADNKLEGKLIYSNGTKWANLNSSRTPAIQGNNLTTALCHTWNLTKEDAGAGNFDGADSIAITFSAFGTYLVEIFDKGAVVEKNLNYWKWHPSKANTLVYRWYDDPEFDEENDQLIIYEATADVLRCAEFFDENEDGIKEELKYKMVPASVK